MKTFCLFIYKFIYAGTYSQLYVQIVFAVQNRNDLINPLWEERLYQYISTILQNKDPKVIAICGMPDHVYLFVGIKLSCRLSDLVREIKKWSNDFINENHLTNFKFKWQEGYGCFSYSHSQINDVAKYVLNQKLHHQKRQFKDEYIAFLKKFNVDYDDKFLFDWIGAQ